MSPANLTNPSPQLSVVLQWYKAITAWKFDVLEELFSDDYMHKTLPASANEEPKNKAEGIGHAKAVGALFGYKPLQVCFPQSLFHGGVVLSSDVVFPRHSTRSSN
jgi:hypothetical protein